MAPAKPAGAQRASERASASLWLFGWIEESNKQNKENQNAKTDGEDSGTGRRARLKATPGRHARTRLIEET